MPKYDLFDSAGMCVVLRLNSTMENIYLTSCPPMSTLYLKHSYRKVMQAVLSSICCIKVTTIRWMWLGFHVRRYMSGQQHWCMLCYVHVCVCELQHCIFLLPTLPRSISLPHMAAVRMKLFSITALACEKLTFSRGRQLITSFSKPLCRSVIKTNWFSQWSGTPKYGCICKRTL